MGIDQGLIMICPLNVRSSLAEQWDGILLGSYQNHRHCAVRIRKQKTLTRALNFFKNKIIGYFECYDGMTGILKILWAGPSREPNPVPLSCQSDR